MIFEYRPLTLVESAQLLQPWKMPQKSLVLAFDLYYTENAQIYYAYLRKIKEYHGKLSLVSLFNGISTFVGYLMPKPFSQKNSSGTI